MTTSILRSSILPTILFLFTITAQAASIGSVSGSTVTLTAGRLDGVQAGMTAKVYATVTVEGRTTEVEFAKVQVTAVDERSCTASVLKVLTASTGLELAPGQKVVFQQELVPPARRGQGGSEDGRPKPPSVSPKDPYAGLSPLELSEKADAAYGAERFDDAEKLYAALLRAVPDDPAASKRLAEITERKRGVEAEARKQVDRAEKLKNASYYLSRGDDAYKAGDFATAASYYGKVADVDESYQDAGAKYWLSKARAAGAARDAATLREAKDKLRGMNVPESLLGDLASLGLNAGDVKTHSKDGIEYVYIPQGTFQMGWVPGDTTDQGGIKPRHAVTISKGFWLSKTEVTVGAYKRFCAATGRPMRQPPSFNEGWKYEDYPMNKVSWDDAKAYCEWAGGRLPTEAEWEYAARSGTETAYYWGNSLDAACAWFSENSREQAHPVGEKRANAWGLFDVVGNLWEWCSDWCDESYYSRSPGVDPAGPGSGLRRALRGGSYADKANLYLSARGRMPPAAWTELIGFRCLLTTAPLGTMPGQTGTPSPPPAVVKPLEASSIHGKYVSEGDAGDYLAFKADGTFALRYQGRSLRGKYAFDGESIALDAEWIKEGTGQVLVFSETTIYWNYKIWEKQAGP